MSNRQINRDRKPVSVCLRLCGEEGGKRPLLWAGFFLCIAHVLHRQDTVGPHPQSKGRMGEWNLRTVGTRKLFRVERVMSCPNAIQEEEVGDADNTKALLLGCMEEG